MENFSYFGFTMNFTGIPQYNYIKSIIERICNNIQDNFKMHPKLSHKELLLSLINKGSITIDCLPTDITIEDLTNQLLSEISP